MSIFIKKEVLLVVASLILYIDAPDRFNWSFNLLCACLFVLFAIVLVIEEFRKGNYLSFNLVFLFSYFWTTFAYSVLVYNTSSDRGNVINTIINWNNLSHVAALGLVFIAFYMWGYSVSKKKKGNVNESNRILRPPMICYFFSFFGFLGTAAYTYFIEGKAHNTMGRFAIYLYLTFLALSLYINIKNNSKSVVRKDIFSFFRINRIVLISSAFLFIVEIILGDRELAIDVIMLILAAYYFFWNRISLKLLAIFSIFFLLLMFFVRQTRNDETNNFLSGRVTTESIKDALDVEEGFIYMFADLFYINRELSLGYDYSQTHELYHPEKIFITPFYAIPMLPGIVSRCFLGLTPAEMDSGEELNSVALYNLDSKYEGAYAHLGNHPASDLLMSYGIFGMCFFALLYGYIIGYFDKNKYLNIYTGCCFLSLMAWSIFLPRALAFTIIRPIGYTLFWGYLIYRIPFRMHR